MDTELEIDDINLPCVLICVMFWSCEVVSCHPYRVISWTGSAIRKVSVLICGGVLDRLYLLLRVLFLPGGQFS